MNTKFATSPKLSALRRVRRKFVLTLRSYSRRWPECQIYLRLHVTYVKLKLRRRPEYGPRSSMPQPDLEYILGYGSSGWLSGHLRAAEKSEMPAAAAAPYATVIPRKFLTVPGFGPQDLWLYQKDDGTFRLISRRPLDGLDILTSKIEKNVPAFNLLLSPMNLGWRTFRKSTSKNGILTRHRLGGGSDPTPPSVFLE